MSKNFKLRHSISAFSLSLVMIVCLATAAGAGDKPQITFAPGTDSASRQGEIQGMDRDIYPITATAGQTMRVTVANKLHLVLFRIQKPGAREAYLPKAGADDDATQWEGALPVSGTYKIIVGAMRGEDTHYVLHVRIGPRRQHAAAQPSHP